MRGIASVSDHELMERTRAGDAAAFAELVDRHTGAVLGFLRRYLGDAHRCEDAAQEVFLRVYRAAPSYRPEARFTTWLYAIALNFARDAHKHERRRVPLAFRDWSDGAADGAGPAGPEGDGPERAAERHELRAVVREAVARVPEPYRTALVLRDLQGLSYEESAEVLECPVGTVKSRVNRARCLFAEAWTTGAARPEPSREAAAPRRAQMTVN